MSIICRPAEPQDIPKAIAIRAVASSNFKEKYGFVGKKKEEVFTPDSFYAFTMAHEPEGFWVAEEGGRMVGMMIVWVRDTFWFLSYLFVTPEYQDRKVGTHLLDTAFQNMPPSKISNRALITYAYNTASIAIYMKYGIFSREAVYKMAGTAHSSVPRFEKKYRLKSCDLKAVRRHSMILPPSMRRSSDSPEEDITHSFCRGAMPRAISSAAERTFSVILTSGMTAR